MNKIREIMHNNLSGWKDVNKTNSNKITCEYRFYEEDFDKLEKELLEYIYFAIRKAYLNPSVTDHICNYIKNDK